MIQTRVTRKIGTGIDDSRQTGLLDCPIEILIQIFEYYVSDKLNRLHHLALVCKLWNNIVTDIPTLWTHIVITIVTIPNGSFSHIIDLQLHLVRRFITKSGDFPLDIHIDLSAIRYRGHFKDLQLLFDLLYAEIHRWRSLYIIFPQNLDLSQIACQYLYGRPPRLAELGLRDFSMRMSQTTSFTDLPSLKMLVLDSGFAYKEMVTSFSLASLQSLDIDLHGFEMWDEGMGAPTWPSDISLARSLRSLRIRCSRSGGATYYAKTLERPLLLPLLRKLEICKVERIGGITFDLPALQTLIFDAIISKPSPDLAQTHPAEEVIWRPTLDLS
ncbi:hypothetical protein M408DRAFT_22633, partial [Serendipita vermifera MAFF 305830]